MMDKAEKALVLVSKLQPVLAVEYDTDVRITALKVLITIYESEKVNTMQEEMLRKAFAAGEDVSLNS